METINVLCATDDNYAPYCGIMLTSLLESNRSHQFNVYVVEDGSLSSCTIRKFHGLEERYGCTITLKKVDESLLAGFPVNRTSHLITLPTYYRLLATEVLPNTIDKVIYFDSDIIVSGDIEPLWTTDLRGKSIAAVWDCVFNYDSNCCERLGFPFGKGYFNAGVLVLNLDYWRDNDTYRKAVMYAERNAPKLAFMDQDILNGLLFDSKVTLPERYNFQTEFFFNSLWNNYPEGCRAKLLEESKKAVVVHYCGAVKPWHFRYYKGAFHSIWHRFRKQSLWKHSIVNNPFGKYIKFVVKKLLYRQMLEEQMSNIWVVLAQNQNCYL